MSEVFSAHGWDLMLLDVSDERIRTNFPQSRSASLDLTNAEETHQHLQSWPTPDAVLNIAGGFSMQAAQDATSLDMKRMFDLNFQTLFNTVTAVLPGMIAQKRGFIAGISAGAGLSGGAGLALYSASKAAVALYLDALTPELAPHGIRVSTLYPMGAIDTPGNRVAMPKSNRNQWIDPYQIAQALMFLATRDARGHVRELRIESIHP